VISFASALALYDCDSGAGSDAGSDGAGRTDAGAIDARVTDGGAFDAGVIDAGVIDAGAFDGSTSAGCEDARVCESFDGPSLPDAFTVVMPDCSGDGRVDVDPAIGRSGASARITSSGGYCNHAFLSVPITERGTVHVRFYVRMSEPIGDPHVTFLAMNDEETGADLRLGGQARVIAWNREIDDATLPALSPAGIAMSRSLDPERFTCVEFAIDTAAGTLQTRLDGVAIDGLSVDGVATPDVDEQFLRRSFHPSPTDLKLGWESYGSTPMTVWVDDLAIASRPIGC
jgi:hypothetical protein